MKRRPPCPCGKRLTYSQVYNLETHCCPEHEAQYPIQPKPGEPVLPDAWCRCGNKLNRRQVKGGRVTCGRPCKLRNRGHRPRPYSKPVVLGEPQGPPAPSPWLRLPLPCARCGQQDLMPYVTLRRRGLVCCLHVTCEGPAEMTA